MSSRIRPIIPAAFLALVVVLGLTLLTVFVRSPYTHANLLAGYSTGYHRTEQALVGSPAPLTAHSGMSGMPGMADPVAEGRELFVTADCASCHGLKGQGGTFAPPIAGFEADTISKRVHDGPGGMPAYADGTFTQEQLQAIAAYLQSVGKAGTGK